MLVRRCGRSACSSIRAPIIAVLAQPDNQELGERADAYNRLIKDMAVLPVAAAPAQGRTGFVHLAEPSDLLESRHTHERVTMRLIHAQNR